MCMIMRCHVVCIFAGHARRVCLDGGGEAKQAGLPRVMRGVSTQGQAAGTGACPGLIWL